MHLFALDQYNTAPVSLQQNLDFCRWLALLYVAQRIETGIIAGLTANKTRS